MLEVNDLVRWYGRTQALDGLSFSIPANTTTAFVGANGAGKTTTFSLIGGYLRPNSGQVLIDGKPLRQYRAQGGHLGLLPQDMLFFENRSVWRQMLLLAGLSGLSRAEAAKEATRVLELAGLSDKAKERVEKLSHGMRVRLGVAQAFLCSPPIVLLDEPMAGLDPKRRMEFRSVLTEVSGRTTIIVSSHELSELEEFCDYVCMIDAGKLVKQGAMEDVLGKSSRSMFVIEHSISLKAELEAEFPDYSFREEVGNWIIVEYKNIETRDLNTAMLKWLLNKGVAILEIKTGSRLEDEFLKAADK